MQISEVSLHTGKGVLPNQEYVLNQVLTERVPLSLASLGVDSMFVCTHVRTYFGSLDFCAANFDTSSASSCEWNRELN